ncbi:MAG: aspartate kinase [Thermoplasmata archaeon]|nr:aspartate kinase [Thermoplasmata archaeon]
MPAERPRVVVKFGGAALERADGVLERVRSLLEEGTSPVVVVSAREGVTDRLIASAEHPRDRRQHADAVRWIVRRHPGLPRGGATLVTGLRRALSHVETGNGPDDRVDRLLSYGERFSASWVSVALRRAGVDAVPVETDQAGLIVRRTYDRTEIDLEGSTTRFAPALRRLLQRGRTPVLTGFFGALRNRRVATLGRGGSDYSATAIGALLEARRVELVKRHASVLSADPAQVPGAFVVPRLSYDEAEELARFGARVLHPLTLDPVRSSGIEVWVRALDDPTAVTVIGPPRPEESCRAVTSLPALSLLQVRVPRGRTRAPAVARLAAELRRDRVPVIAWLTAPVGVGIVLDAGSGGRLGTSRSGSVFTGAPREPPVRVDLVTLVGDGVVTEFGRVPRTVLRRAKGVAVSARSFSFAIPRRQSLFAIRALHEALVASRRADYALRGLTAGRPVRRIDGRPPAAPSRRSSRPLPSSSAVASVLSQPLSARAEG